MVGRWFISFWNGTFLGDMLFFLVFFRTFRAPFRFNPASQVRLVVFFFWFVIDKISRENTCFFFSGALQDSIDVSKKSSWRFIRLKLYRRSSVMVAVWCPLSKDEELLRGVSLRQTLKKSGRLWRYDGEWTSAETVKLYQFSRKLDGWGWCFLEVCVGHQISWHKVSLLVFIHRYLRYHISSSTICISMRISAMLDFLVTPTCSAFLWC